MISDAKIHPFHPPRKVFFPKTGDKNPKPVGCFPPLTPNPPRQPPRILLTRHPVSTLRVTTFHFQFVCRTNCNLYAVPITYWTALHAKRVFRPVYRLLPSYGSTKTRSLWCRKDVKYLVFLVIEVYWRLIPTFWRYSFFTNIPRLCPF